MIKSLFLVLTLSISAFTFSQDGIVIHVDGQTTDISGASHTVVAPSSTSFDIALDVENNTVASRTGLRQGLEDVDHNRRSGKNSQRPALRC